jgi:hypothetical protein
VPAFLFVHFVEKLRDRPRPWSGLRGFSAGADSSAMGAGLGIPQEELADESAPTWLWKIDAMAVENRCHGCGKVTPQKRKTPRKGRLA